MNIILERFSKIKSNIDKLNNKDLINIIAVSKTFPLEHIEPLISYGHIHFGENKLQEAQSEKNSGALADELLPASNINGIPWPPQSVEMQSRHQQMRTGWRAVCS